MGRGIGPPLVTGHHSEQLLIKNRADEAGECLTRGGRSGLECAARINAEDLITVPAADSFGDLGEAGNTLPDPDVILPHILFCSGEELRTTADVKDSEAVEAGEVAAITG